MVVRVQPSLPCKEDVHKAEGQFRLLVGLMLVFFGAGMFWTALLDQGWLHTAEVAEVCFEFAKDLFLVALGMFRGMPSSGVPHASPIVPKTEV